MPDACSAATSAEVALKPSTSYIETMRKGAFGTDDRTQFQLVRSGGGHEPAAETRAGPAGAAPAPAKPAGGGPTAAPAPAAGRRARRGGGPRGTGRHGGRP